MIVLPHCICDGITIVNLMREILSFLDNPNLSLNPYNTFHSVEELIREELLPGKAAVQKAKLFSGIANIFLTLKTINAKIFPRKSYRIRWKLNPELSGQIIRRCKEEGVTVHTALGVALLQAFQTIRGKAAKNKMICPVDIRKEVPAIKADMMFAFAPIVNLSLSGDQKLSFWDTARQMKTDLQDRATSLKLNEMLVLSENFHTAAPKMVRLLKATKGSHDVTFSNMGKLDIPVKYTSFEVVDAFTPIASFPWRNPNTIVSATFNGQMDFTFIADEAIRPYEAALAIKKAAMDTLKRNCNTLQPINESV